jgi:hypothetical protein
MLVQVVYLISCGICRKEYVFIELNIFILISVAPRCPNCQQPISKDRIVNDKDLQKEIQNFEIYCTYKDKGCDWDGTLRDLQIHIESCGFIIIECLNGCGAKYERRFMAKHQNEDCAKRIVTCEFCMTKKNNNN